MNSTLPCKILLCLLLNFIFIANVYPQYNTQLLSVKKDIDKENYDAAFAKLKQLKYKAISPANQAMHTYLTAVCYENGKEVSEAYKNYIEAKKKFMAIDSTDMAMTINLKMAYLLSAQETSNAEPVRYVNEYMEYAKKNNKGLMMATGYAALAMYDMLDEKYDKSLKNYRKAIALNKKYKDENLESTINNNLAVLFSEVYHKPDSALYYLKKDYAYIVKKKPQDLGYSYVNQASAYSKMKDYKKAITLLKMADMLLVTKYDMRQKCYIYEFLYTNYDSLKDYKNAYQSLLKRDSLKDTLNATEQNIAINDIQTKYKTREKELENQVLKSNIKTNKILLYTISGLLVALLALGFLIVKNSRRKEKISHQEKLINQQKLEKALKDYELSSIDMMLEGQEKERQRIANDLHDNLGSMLATLKLNFENLKLRKDEVWQDENKLYEKTDELIEEAYQKVRRLAHAKNAGVFASEGLIPAIKKLAEKISIPNKLQIQVVPFGFTDRLDNTLEIAIFRMVQELATNIIKHSKATEATIHLTHHEDNINMLIEDNGVGIDTDKADIDQGMGLSSMKKKIEQLLGSFAIDTTPGKGTTIIIDLPV